MNQMIVALQNSIINENWYSVLFISLSLPDICGKIDEPHQNSKTRTINWFSKYLKEFYTLRIGPDREEHCFLSGADFYALRCAYLHEGSDKILSQKARETLETFRFTQPVQKNSHTHKNKINNTLQLQVSKFGEEVLTALINWNNDIKDDPVKQEKVKNLLKIEITSSVGFNF
ncbi:hypothetical protein LRQ09_11235 [Acinetobacter soli]|uniref:hypothetical protein n=1 Tax=Acinetobacter soli TaxID=487316 RepID=UPI001F1EC254|nr:hypothetical protein [Acinetobacter soli]MCF3127940.1 hypothetical protein [Acinetobacter soli]